MTNTTKRPAAEPTRCIWEQLWTDYIACLRNGHLTKAAELKQKMAEFDAAL